MEAPQKPLSGHYRFSRGLQTGAKSVSWLAVDEKTRRTVIASALGAARVAGLEGIVGVRHPHLAAIVDVIHDADEASLPDQASKAAAVVVAEYMRGTTLHERLRSGRPELGEAVRIVERIAQAVESLHAIGGVHGAISPRSVVVAPENAPQGPVLTQLVAPPSGSYCSPERLRGHGPSTTDDMWALHATLYATLTGTTPFSGTTREKLVNTMVSTGVRPLAEHGIDDTTLQEIIARGLAPEPDERCTDVEELQAALHAWQETHSSEEAQKSPAPPPIEPTDDDEAEWDDDNARTIVSSAAELLAAARAAAVPDETEAERGLDLSDEEYGDDAPTSVVDISTFKFPVSTSPDSDAPAPPDAAEAPESPRQSSSGALPPVPAPPRPVPAPPRPAAGTSAYADDDEVDDEAATRILDSQEVFAMAGESVEPEANAAAPPVPAAGVPFETAGEAAADATPFGAAEEASAEAGVEPFPPVEASGEAPPFAPAGEPVAQAEGAPFVPGPTTPQDAAAFAASPESVKPRRSGVLLWALVTLTIAFAVVAYLARHRLMQVLASVGLVSAPPATTVVATPQGGSTRPAATGSSAKSTEAGALATASGDAGVSGDAAAGDAAATAGGKPRPKAVGACVLSYFLPGTFHSDKGFDFLCKDNDFRKTNAELYRRIVVSGGGKVSPGMKEWSTFDWYELAATAVVRHGCCPADTKPIDLPSLGGPCPRLDKVLTQMAATPPKPAEISSRTEAYASAVSCLYKNKIPHPYHYKAPQSANRAAFEQFWRRAVTQYRE